MVKNKKGPGSRQKGKKEGKNRMKMKKKKSVDQAAIFNQQVAIKDLAAGVMSDFRADLDYLKDK